MVSEDLGMGVRLKAARAERGLSIEGLARVSGITTRTIQRIESGVVVPRHETWLRLVEALGHSRNGTGADNGRLLAERAEDAVVQ